MRDELQKKVDKACASIRGLAKGTVINHLGMETLIGIERIDKARYYQMVGRIKRTLVKEGFFFRTLNGIGYQIVFPGEEIGLCTGRFARGLKTCTRSVRDSQHININGIDDNGKRAETIETATKLSNIQNMMLNAFQAQIRT